MIRVLIVDDDQTRIDQFIQNNPGCDIDYTKCIEGGIDYFMAKADSYDIICLDHDLGIFSDIMPLVKYIQKYIDDGGKCNFQILIHSANPIGSANILSHLKYTPIICTKMHFPWRIGNLFNILMGAHD
jgi:hypothetical protein